MNAAFVGLPAREAAALKIFIGVGMKGWTSAEFAPRAGAALPRADVYIIDLAGAGLAQWSAKAEADLLTMLGGHSALLLNLAHNRSWNDKTHAMQGRGKQKISCMAKPYGREDMRAALEGFVAGGAVPERAGRAEPGPQPASTTARSLPVPPPSLFSSLQVVRSVFPDLQKHLLLCKLLDLLATGQPYELRLTVHQAIILHPAQGWVAHNAGPEVLARFVQQGHSVPTMSVRELDTEEAVQRCMVHMTLRESLDTFLWGLAEASIGRQTPTARRDAELKLCSMPGFTRLSGVSDLQLQLAAICVRVPQTLSGLRAVFPDHDPAEIARFLLLSTVSGLGRLRLVEPATRACAERRPVPRAAKAHQGFFKSMLKKLF